MTTHQHHRHRRGRTPAAPPVLFRAPCKNIKIAHKRPATLSGCRGNAPNTDPRRKTPPAAPQRAKRTHAGSRSLYARTRAFIAGAVDNTIIHYRALHPYAGQRSPAIAPSVPPRRASPVAATRRHHQPQREQIGADGGGVARRGMFGRSAGRSTARRPLPPRQDTPGRPDPRKMQEIFHIRELLFRFYLKIERKHLLKCRKPPKNASRAAPVPPPAAPAGAGLQIGGRKSSACPL